MTEKLLRIDDVRAATGLCRSAVYSTAGFPKPVKLGAQGGDGAGGQGRAVAWVASEVAAWIQATIAASRRESAGASNG
jgi:predicted DNA-binding transcriptional regulator AlpA